MKNEALRTWPGITEFLHTLTNKMPTTFFISRVCAGIVKIYAHVFKILSLFGLIVHHIVSGENRCLRGCRES